MELIDEHPRHHHSADSGYYLSEYQQHYQMNDAASSNEAVDNHRYFVEPA